MFHTKVIEKIKTHISYPIVRPPPGPKNVPFTR